jgi:hypothetical protein
MAYRLGHRFAFVAATLLGVWAASSSAPAAAQEGPAGAVSLVLLVGDERSAPDGRSATSGSERADYGAGAIADLFYELGVLRVGGALGVAAASSADGVRSRVYMPLAASASLFWRGESVGFDVRARIGAWAGATDAGLDADFFASVGAWLSFPLGGRASLGVGLDAWFQRAGLRPGERGVETYVSPGLALVWGAPGEDPLPAEETSPSPEQTSPSTEEPRAPAEPASPPPAVPAAPPVPPPAPESQPLDPPAAGGSGAPASLPPAEEN